MEWTRKPPGVLAFLEICCVWGDGTVTQMFDLARSDQPIWTTLVHGSWCDSLIVEDGLRSPPVPIENCASRPRHRQPACHIRPVPHPAKIGSGGRGSRALVGQDGLVIRTPRRHAAGRPSGIDHPNRIVTITLAARRSQGHHLDWCTASHRSEEKPWCRGNVSAVNPKKTTWPPGSK